MKLQKLQTPLDWESLAIHKKTKRQLHQILDEVGIESNYTALFHGASGTGKTLAGALFGKQLGKEIGYVNLSLVVSKYIGETEKNLGLLFEEASEKGWILFFDEADALFGKRTEVRDAHDKYANQEVSYLLQRIEAHPGIIIFSVRSKSMKALASGLKRRFKYVVKFRKTT